MASLATLSKLCLQRIYFDMRKMQTLLLSKLIWEAFVIEQFSII